MVQSLCEQYSPALLSLPDPLEGSKVQTYHPFPPPSVLAAPEVSTTLRSLGFGYRAEFIQRTAKMLVDRYGCTDASAEHSENWLKSLRGRGTAEAREELLQFVGVGRKVADCILLMSLDKVRLFLFTSHPHN
jgi:N-glycosylase/DNA lyase